MTQEPNQTGAEDSRGAIGGQNHQSTRVHRSTAHMDSPHDELCRHLDLVHSTCLRVLGNHQDASDATQEVAMKWMRLRRDIRGSTAAWLHKVAHSTAVDLIRRRESRRRAEQHAVAGDSEEFVEPPEAEEKRPTGLSTQIDAALSDLPTEQRALLIEHHLQGLSQMELARRWRLSQARISRRLTQARDTLAAALARRAVTIGGVALVSALSSELQVAPCPVAIRQLVIGRIATTTLSSGTSSVAAAATVWKVTAIAAVIFACVASVGVAVVYALASAPPPTAAAPVAVARPIRLSPGHVPQPPPPQGSLIPSGSVTASADGQIIENLLITASGDIAVDIAGHANVTVRNCYIIHARVGVRAFGSENPTVDHCAFVRDPLPARGAGDPESAGVWYRGCSGSMVVSNCEFWEPSVAINMEDCAPGAHIFNINGFNMMGPDHRGQLVDVHGCPKIVIEDFYNLNDLDASWTESNIAVWNSEDVIVRRGCVDGNNCSTGMGVAFAADPKPYHGGLCEDVDALHQGHAAFAAANVIGVRFNRVRTRDGHVERVGGRKAQQSNGLSFLAERSSGIWLEGTYHRPANPGNLIWDARNFTHAAIRDENFIPRGRIVLVGMPYAPTPISPPTDAPP